MLEIDEKAMAYCLVEALFAAGVINLPTYQNFLRMKREQEEEPPARLRKQQRKALAEGIRPEPFFLPQKRVRDNGG